MVNCYPTNGEEIALRAALPKSIWLSIRCTSANSKTRKLKNDLGCKIGVENH